MKMKVINNQKPQLNPGFYGISDGFFSLGFVPVGVDEAGRGSLAGPVVAAAVVFPRGITIDGINDSKKLSKKNRDDLSLIIREKSDAFAFGYSSVDEIDDINILQASLKAMKRAVEEVSPLFTDLYALIDGNKSPDLDCRHECIVRGDSLCFLIASASILAKVERDAYMESLSKDYPEYGFEKHKGYGTAAHREAIRKFGPSRVHRKSFSYGL